MQDNYQKTIDEIEASVKEAMQANGFHEISLENEFTMSELAARGDISTGVSFKVGKLEERSPKEIAGLLAGSIKRPECVESVSAENGFINFRLDRGRFWDGSVAELIGLRNRTKSDIGKGKRAIIEYPSVNPNKPWHIGHVRNALIGDTISNLYESCGYSVERENLINDMGLQVAETVWGCIHIKESPNKKYDHWLGELYVKVNKLMEGRDLKEELSQMLSLIEQDGTYESKIERKMAEKCVAAQYETAFNYRIYQDLLVWESDIVRARLLEKALKLLEDKKAITREKEGKYAGCTIINFTNVTALPENFKGLKETVKVLIRANGTATYAAKDIAFHMWKFGMIEDPFTYSQFIEKQPNGRALSTTSAQGRRLAHGEFMRAINVIDASQSYEQEVVKLAFLLLGREDIAGNIRHLAYNVVELESGSFSGRKGTWVGYSADDLFEEAKGKAQKLITERLKLDESEKAKVAESVALASIKFEFLRISPERKIVFSWERALNFEGISGPYCQYMHARASRITESASAQGRLPSGTHPSSVTDEEFRLVKQLSRHAHITEKACREERTNVITDYCGELASAFSSFYEKVPVLKAASKEDIESRVGLVSAFKDTLQSMLALLGIDAPEKM